MILDDLDKKALDEIEKSYKSFLKNKLSRIQKMIEK